MNTLSILLVEDDERLRFALTEMLQRHGHQVTQAADAAAAISALEQRGFNVLLTDLLLGETDGIEVIRLAKTKYPATRVVAMSGGGERLHVSYLLRLARGFGACVSLAKPFASDELLAAVDPAQPVTGTPE